MDSRATWPRTSSRARVREVSYPWGLSFRPPVLSSIALFVAAIAGCDGALQFSGSSASSGGDELQDALDASADRGMGSAPPCYKDIDCPSSKLHCDIVSHQCVECI